MVLPPIDKAAIKLGAVIIPDKIYTQKRKWQNKPIAIRVNDMIVRQYEPDKIKKTFSTYQNQLLVEALGNWSARNLTWTDDKTLDKSGDYYLYPEEIVVSKKGDCEDHSFLNASWNPDIVGVGYGYYTDKTGKRFGHAWNLYTDDKGKLRIMDTTGNTNFTSAYPNPLYETYYIITRNGTYQVKSGVEFGTIAKW